MKRLLVFGLVGAANTIATYALFLLLVHLLSPGIAYVVAYLAGLLAAITANLKITLQTNVDTVSFSLSAAVYLFSMVVSAGFVSLQTRWGIEPWLSGIFGIAVSFTLNYLGLWMISSVRRTS